MKTRLYSELIRLDSYVDRFEYLTLTDVVGDSTFGFDRYINQEFYRSYEWRKVREHVIVRDNGCDLAFPGYDIYKGPVVHHMNPMRVDDIVHGEEWILDPEFLITTTHDTHNDIHYGVMSVRRQLPVDRSPGDTIMW